jgi:hypothetical protein
VEIEWLAEHLESCPACSGGGERGQNEFVEVLRSKGKADEMPGDDFFAAQRETIMGSVRAEPRKSLPRPRVRLVGGWRSYAGIGLAAGLALFIAWSGMRPSSRGDRAQLALAPPAVESELANQDQVDVGQYDDDGWLLAAGDPLEGARRLSVKDLDDAELDELDAVLSSEEG